MQLSLLDRIDAVEADSISMISSYDKSVCESLQEKFHAFTTFASKYIKFIDENGVNAEGVGVEYDFRNPEVMKEQMMKQVREATDHFIHNIVWHFQKTYSVSMSSSGLGDKYDHNVTYQDIVREIVEQLGGLNFEEKAIHEIKDKIRGDVNGRYSRNEITVSKSKLCIGGHFIYWSDSWQKGKYRPNGYDCSTQNHLFTALSHFECGSTNLLNCFHFLCRHDDRSDWFDKFEFEWLNKVKASKFYKNGKVDIHFASAELAKQFALEYLGANL